MPASGALISALGNASQMVAAPLNLIKSGFDYFGARSAQKKAEQELSNLKPVFYKIQNEYKQNRDLAASQAVTGMPEATKNYLTTESQRGLGTGVGALNQMGGNPNDVNRLFSTFENSIDRTAAQDAQARIENIQNFMNVNKELAGQKNMAWTLNEYRPYENKLKQLTKNIEAEKLNKNNALNSAIGSISAAGTANQNSKLMDKLFPGVQDSSVRLPPIDSRNSIIEPIQSRSLAVPSPTRIQVINNGYTTSQEPFSLSNNEYGE